MTSPCKANRYGCCPGALWETSAPNRCTHGTKMFIRRQAPGSLGWLSSALQQLSCRSFYLLIAVRTLLMGSEPNQGLAHFTGMDVFIQHTYTAQQADDKQQDNKEQKAEPSWGLRAWTTENGRFKPGFSNGLLVSLEHLHVVHVGLPVLHVAAVVRSQHPHVVMRPGHCPDRTVVGL